MARQFVGDATRQQLERLVKPLGDLRGGQQLDARRGQFNGERDAFQPAADGCDGAGVLLAEGKAGGGAGGARDEEANGVVLQEVVGAG